jgi:hypothetical protein
MVDDVWHPFDGVDYHAIDIKELSFDDALWKNLLIADRDLQQVKKEYAVSVDEKALVGLMSLGIYDDDINNQLWIRRSLGHSSAMTSRLWSMLLAERAKVGDQLVNL